MAALGLHVPVVDRPGTSSGSRGGHSETHRQSGVRHGRGPWHRARHRGSVRRGRRRRRDQRPRRRGGAQRSSSCVQGEGTPRHRGDRRRRRGAIRWSRRSPPPGTTLGPIDILVNNAGIETIVPFLELTDDQWTRLVDTNLRGAWLCSQIVCRRVVEAKRAGEHRQHRLDPGGQGAARAARTTRRPSSGSKR